MILDMRDKPYVAKTDDGWTVFWSLLPSIASARGFDAAQRTHVASWREAVGFVCNLYLR